MDIHIGWEYLGARRVWVATVVITVTQIFGTIVLILLIAAAIMGGGAE